MFRNVFLTLFVISSSIISAQMTYGTIDYVRSVEIDLEESLEASVGDSKAIRNAFAEMTASGGMDDNYKATFTPDAFTFIKVIKPITSRTIELAGGNTITMEMGGGEATYHHTDLAENKIHNSTTIADRMFLVQGEGTELDWRLTGETVPPGVATMGLELKIATAVNAMGDTIIAGFAPALPVKVGPENYYGPYGAIITLRIPRDDKNVVVYRASGLAPLQEAPELEKGTEGKAITPERYRKEVLKRRKKSAIITQRH